MKHDVGANPAGAFQFDDSISRFPVDSEAEVEDIEPGNGLDVAHVEQYSAEHGLGWSSLLPLAQSHASKWRLD